MLATRTPAYIPTYPNQQVAEDRVWALEEQIDRMRRYVWELQVACHAELLEAIREDPRVAYRPSDYQDEFSYEEVA